MKRGLAFIPALLFCLSLSGQCPDRDFLWHRIIFLRDSSGVETAKQLDELLGYEKKMDQCSYRNDSTHALLLQRIGWLYTTKNDFFNAIQYTQKSISLVNQQKNNSAINPASVIKSYWNLHYMYESLKLETKEIAAVDSCISYIVYLRTGYNIALDALAIIVPHLFNTGDYFRCVSYATLGESIINKTSATAVEAEDNGFVYFYWKMNSFIFLKKTDEAGKFLVEKIRFAERNRRINMRATLYGLYAAVLRDQGKPAEAISYFKKCFYFNEQAGYKTGCAQALNNIGFIYFNRLCQNKLAIPYYFKALKYADAIESLNILGNIANIYAKAGSYDSAFSYFQKAFNQLGPGFTDTDLLKNDTSERSGDITEYITDMVLAKAATWLTKYKATGSKQALEEAIRIYQLTDRYFDKLKASQSELLSKLFWKTNNRKLYEEAIEACYASHSAEKAFYFFEKSRSVLLNDQIMEQREMNDRDIAKQALLKKDKLEIERNLQNTAPSSNENFALQQQLFTNKEEQQILMKNINSKHPSYAQNYSDTTSLTLGSVRKKILDANKSLLEIFTGDSAIYVLSVTSNDASFIKLNKHLYDSLTTAYISFVDNRSRLNQDFQGFISVSHQLYELIFQNIQLQAGGSLIISPDGRSFPFEALVTHATGSEPHYLLTQYATSYTYSAKYLTNQFAVNTKTNKSILGIAPVQYKNNRNLATLYGSDNSLENINNYFTNATNYVFENATKSNFIENFPRYNIIQLYTHASDSSINNDPVIYFVDSPLYLSALVPYRKPVTQLVILSACETANGKLYEGEGIFSFNRGFAALGIPAAISNLWSVDNVSTYGLTELFYKYLSQGFPTDVALQKAKLAFMNNSSSIEKKLPFFWAGSILTGKVDTIKNNPPFPWNKLIGATILLLAMVYVTRRALRPR